ncbi:MAG: ABC transporter permease [Betaproteobacteria bacterium]|nr:ABC transporter permease [Betaproteobacteria bacterium]
MSTPAVVLEPARGWTHRFRANPTSWLGLALIAAVVLAAVFASSIWPVDPLEQNIADRLMAPSAQYLLGTDSYGRDVLARLLHAARISLTISVLAITLAMVVGSAIGITAGYLGGWVDAAVTSLLDVLLSFPTLLLGLMVVAMLGPSIENLVIAIALTELAPFARVARAPTISLKGRDFVEAGRALGFSDLRLVVVHIIPNLLSEIVVVASMWLATAIRTEASLSFIGLGVKPPTPTWGGMIREGFENILDAPWLAVAPGIAILITVLGLNLLGDGLRDAIDPKAQRD